MSIDGSPINTDELVIKVHYGLGRKYNAMSFAICFHENPIIYKELIEKLFSRELLLLHTPKPEMPPLIGPLTT